MHVGALVCARMCAFVGLCVAFMTRIVFGRIFMPHLTDTWRALSILHDCFQSTVYSSLCALLRNPALVNVMALCDIMY